MHIHKPHVLFIDLCISKYFHLRVVGHGYCAAVKECADLGFVVNYMQQLHALA